MVLTKTVREKGVRPGPKIKWNAVQSTTCGMILVVQDGTNVKELICDHFLLDEYRGWQGSNISLSKQKLLHMKKAIDRSQRSLKTPAMGWERQSHAILLAFFLAFGRKPKIGERATSYTHLSL